jgi:outer membrane protein TolC
MKTLVAALLLLALALPASADEAARPPERPPARVLPLSLREAVALSLNHNLDIEIARYQPWIEDQNILAALGTWDHFLYAQASASQSQSVGFSQLSGATQLENDFFTTTLGIRKVLPFGASYDLSYSVDRSESNNSFLLINPRWNQSAGLTLGLPLLRGGSTDANTATLVVARNSRDGAVDDFEKALTDSVFAVAVSYADLAFAIENKKVKEQSLEVARRLLDDNRRKFERGVVARIDVTQADAGVAAREEEIITAEAVIQNVADRLKRLMDPAMLREELTLVPVDRPKALETVIDEKSAVEKAMEEALPRRPELARIRRQIASQDAILARTGNDLLPRLDLQGRVSYSGTHDDFPGAGHEAASGDTRDLTAGLLFEIPLERSAARGAYTRAELDRRRLQLQERNLQNQVLVEVREAVRGIKTNELRIEATRRTRLLAQEQLDGELTRREQGLSTTFRVLDVQEDLILAQTNELKAKLDYHLARVRLRQVTGILLEDFGVVLRDNLQPRVSLASR